MNHYLAIDIGGTAIKSALINQEGRVSSHREDATPDSFDGLLNLLDPIVEQATRIQHISGLAFSVPGAVDSKAGIIFGTSAVPYIHQLPFREVMHERYHVPVTLLNDANAAALAEDWTGAAKTLDRFAVVALGTGVGGALVHNGELLVGSTYHGGEFGYWILDHTKPHPDGTWSSVGSTGALVKACSVALGRPVTGRDVFEMQDDARIEAALEQFYRWNAIGLYNLQYGFDPERILIGGGISRRPEVVTGIQRHLDVLCDTFGTTAVHVATCDHFNEANLIGAVHFHLQSV